MLSKWNTEQCQVENDICDKIPISKLLEQTLIMYVYKQTGQIARKEIPVANKRKRNRERPASKIKRILDITSKNGVRKNDP